MKKKMVANSLNEKLNWIKYGYFHDINQREFIALIHI